MSLHFTYFEAEDRLLVVMHPEGHQLWLTRHLTQYILRDVASLFARAVPGDGIPGSGNGAQRIALEHRMAMNEEDLADLPAGRSAGMQFASHSPPLPLPGTTPLCNGLDAQAGKDYGSITFTAGEQQVTLRQNRPGFHRFLRTILLCADRAGWQIQDIPPWLTQSLLDGLLGTLASTGGQPDTPAC